MTDALIELLQLAGEEKARAIVAGIGTRQSQQAFERVAATAYARYLLDKGYDRRAALYLLASRYGISVPTVYRRIGKALDLPPGESVSTHPPR